MCELLGISSNIETNIKHCMKVMAEHSMQHSDGWGVAYYPMGSKQCNILKEPCCLNESKLAEFLNDNNMVYSKIILNHIRKSKTTRSFENTHPFCRELFGQHWAMIHNGGEGLDNYFKDYLGNHGSRISFVPFGTTGSDKAFCIILNELKERIPVEIHWENDDTFIRASCTYSFDAAQRIIYEECLRIMGSGADFNMILSNGEYMIAFYSGHNHLHYVYRDRQLSEEKQITLGYVSPEFTGLDGIIHKKEVVVATEPLTEDENWVSFSIGEFLVFKEGELVYRNGEPVTSNNKIF